MPPIGLNHYLFLAAALFSIGVIGVLVRRNALVIFMCIELMLNAANLAFIAFSYYLNDVTGQGFVFMSMVVAASEVAVGLAIILSLFRNKETVNVDDIRIMKW
jgi:NADH-quinone oxidoreductase subunit K